jgi:hypothetical protein
MTKRRSGNSTMDDLAYSLNNEMNGGERPPTFEEMMESSFIQPKTKEGEEPSAGNRNNRCKLVMGAPKNTLNDFSAVVYFEDENGRVLLQNNYYADTQTTSIKLPGGKSAEEFISDKLFESALKGTLQAWSYTPRAQELALKKTHKWPKDLSVARVRILRMAMMEVVEEAGLFPDKMEIVCHTITPDKNGGDDYVTVFIKAFNMYDRDLNSGGLKAVEDLRECLPFGVGSPVSTNIIDAVIPVPKGAVLKKLAPTKHKMAFPHLRDFKRPESE